MPTNASAPITQQLDPALLRGLKFRCIGPPRGGRVLAVHGHPTDAMTFYFGACAGGLWKTTDGGTYWENISDGDLGSAAVGALAVSQSDPNVLYAGMGEATIRIDVSWGDGVYKSTDGGRSWRNVGLTDTHHIGEIRIHPTNPDLVYVAALGHAFGPNEERGIFRTKDGGESWEKVLFVSDKAGAVDLAMDATNPRILFASIYETYRTFWNLSSGGPDSGLWRSTDGGDTWEDLSDKPGLPKGLKGKIGVTISHANPSRVWAIVEAEGDKAGLYRSDNNGDSWKLVSNNRDLIHRPWYYCHVFADPQDADTVYVTNLKMWKSTDGGRNFDEITTPHGDNHDLWIDPANPQRMIEGNDGGACVSFNGGQTWSSIYNQMTAQFYHVTTDHNRFPYTVYGTQQDNSSIAVPSATEKGAIPWSDCYPAGTGESGYIKVDPKDDDVVYVGAVGSSPGGGGALQRYDHRTKQIRLVTVWPEQYTGWGAGDLKYRFAWTFPIAFSPHDPTVLYTTGNHVFRSTDAGSSWQAISTDLSRADPETLGPAGGPITLDTSGAEHYATVYAFVESPHEAGVLWAGTDDGLVHISRDGGDSWSEITPPNLPERALISMIEASPHEPGTAWLAATRYKLDDYNPYLFVTRDYGESWTQLDFPAHEITRAVREDPTQRGLLFVGTETGIYVSLDHGEEWNRLQNLQASNDLPVVPVYDLVIKDDDLVIGTHGRSFWVLDDITPLRQMAAELQDRDRAQERVGHFTQLFAPRPTVRRWLGWSVGLFRGPGKNYSTSLGVPATYTEDKTPAGEQLRRMLDAGENPPQGVIVYYTLPENFDADEHGPLSLTIFDGEGNEIKRFRPKPDDVDEESSATNGIPKAAKQAIDPTESFLPAHAGLNRFVWNMRYPNAEKVTDDVMGDAVTGPLAAPGAYRAELSVGDEKFEQDFEIVIDPRVEADADAMQAQFDLWKQINDKVSETHAAINRLRSLRSQVNGWAERIAATNGDLGDARREEIQSSASALREKLSTIESELIQTGSRTPGDRLRLQSRLNTKLAGLISVVASADAAPPQQAHDVYDYLASQIDEQISRLDGLVGDDVAAFNDLVREASVPPVAA